MYRSIIDLLVIVFAAGFFYEALSWCYRVFNSVRWIKRERPRYEIVKNSGRIYLIIPVLAEADILEKTVAYFIKTFLSKRKNVFLVIVTTEREKELNGSSATIDLAKKIAVGDKRILHFHSPFSDGKMAHQINYAIHGLIEGDTAICDSDLIGIYNADSRPEKETLDWIVCNFDKDKRRVFQQYGCYLGNASILGRVRHSKILLSAALWQTRWALGFEIYNAKKQPRFYRENARFDYPFNYCIGHGLFFTKGIFEEVGGFNEKMHNEDAILGLQLSDAQEPIVPVPFFDVSESPDGVRSLYEQQSNWYMGPLQSYEYAKRLLKQKQHTLRGKMRLYFLATKLFFHALYWIVGPTLMFLLLILSIATLNPWCLSASILGSALFVIVPSFLAYQSIREIDVPMDDAPNEHKALDALIGGSFIAYMIHGASAYRGLAIYLRHLFGGNEIKKKKTVMLHRSDG